VSLAAATSTLEAGIAELGVTESKNWVDIV